MDRVWRQLAKQVFEGTVHISANGPVGEVEIMESLVRCERWLEINSISVVHAENVADSFEVFEDEDVCRVRTEWAEDRRVPRLGG